MKQVIFSIILIFSAATVLFPQGKLNLSITSGYSVDSREISHSFNFIGELGYPLSESSELSLVTGVLMGKDVFDENYYNIPILVDYKIYPFNPAVFTPFVSVNAGGSYLKQNEKGSAQYIDGTQSTFKINRDGFYFGGGLGAGVKIKVIEKMNLILKTNVYLTQKGRADFVLLNAGVGFSL